MTAEETTKLLRDHVKKMEQLFEEWRQLCAQHGWKSGLKNNS